jgi:hypothetical protein
MEFGRASEPKMGYTTTHFDPAAQLGDSLTRFYVKIDTEQSFEIEVNSLSDARVAKKSVLEVSNPDIHECLIFLARHTRQRNLTTRKDICGAFKLVAKGPWTAGRYLQAL